jgi:PKD domain
MKALAGIRLTVTTALLALCGLYTTTAHAGPAWLADQPAIAHVFDEKVAVDGAGDTFVAYQTENEEVGLVERPAGGSFGTPQVLSAKDTLSAAPSIAVDSAGDVVVAWEQIVEVGAGKFESQATGATRSAGGTVRSLGVLHPSGTMDTFTVAPTAAENAAGAGLIAWVDPVSDTIEAVVRGGAGESFGSLTAELGKSAGQADSLSAAVDSDGNDVLAFDGNGQAWMLTGRGGSWATSPLQLSNNTATLNGPVSLAVASTQLLFAWSQGSTGEVFASRGTVAGGPSVATDLSDATQNSIEPSVGVDPTGDALVSWNVPPSSGIISDIRASAALAGGAFPLPTQTIDLAKVSDLDSSTTTAMGPSGRAIATWSHTTGTEEVTTGVSWTPAGAFTPAQTISAPSENDLAIQSDVADPLGDGLATWLTTAGTAELAVYDAAPPALSAPTIPASATAGVAASFSVPTPLDVWSEPVAVTWSFGDGATATGTAVTHTYAQAGVYQVKATATDALGNEISQSGSIGVAAASTSGTSGSSANSSGTSGSSSSASPPATASSGGGRPLTVTDLELSPTRFRRGRRAATISAHEIKALPSTTTIAFVLSGAATVTLKFEGASAGVLVGHQCKALSKARRKGRPCTRYVVASHGVSRQAGAGTDRITFAGVLDGGARLAPGTYRLSLLATRGGARASAAQRPTFEVIA